MKLKVTNTMLSFSDERLAKNDRNDCAVRATAIALGEDYNEIHKAYAEAGRPHRRGVKVYMIEDVLKSKLIGVDVKTSDIFLENANWDRRSTPTISQLLKQPKFNVGSHIMITRNHVFTIKNGEIYGNRDDNGRARIEGYITTATGNGY